MTGIMAAKNSALASWTKHILKHIKVENSYISNHNEIV